MQISFKSREQNFLFYWDCEVAEVKMR